MSDTANRYTAAFEQKLADLRNEYNRAVESNQSLIDRIESFDQDNEIKGLKQRLTDCKQRCLHDLIGDERDKYYAFRRKHYDKCKNNGRYVIELNATGIGESIIVKCPLCGEYADITDNSMW